MILRKKVIEGIIKKLQNSHSMSKKDLKKLLEELHVRVSTLHNIATHDDKTGLHNTSFMREIFTLEAAQAERGKPLSAIIIDVDFFKKVNDTYGHLLADILLKKICIVLVRELRPYDILARFGGDEFLVLLPDTRLDVAASVAERVRNSIINDSILAKYSLTMSFGVASFNNKDDFNSLVERADKSLYKSKQAGRNKVSF